MISREGGRIRKLPAHLVNQIAAGEVIERPASVVKELLENAIDAGATEIRIELEEGGKRLVRITDDGQGIAPVDLPLAVASHATSKLASEADLHRIHTLGFRGEALASIASVSELDLVSRPAGQAAGERIVARDGAVSPGPPEAIAPGTRVTVRNLFHSVPARRRFLRGERVELARIHAIVRTIALAMPTVGFTVLHDGRLSLGFPAGQTHRERVAEALGAALAARLVPLPPGEHLSGWIAPPDVHRRGADAVHVYLNGRAIRDRVVLAAVREGYRGFQVPGRHPVAVLFLDLPPGTVDVNVHPTKQEVRFQDPSAVHALVRRAVRAALLAAGSVPALGAVLGSGAEIEEEMETADGRARGPVAAVGRSAPLPVEPFRARPGPSLVREAPAASAPVPAATILAGDRTVRAFQVRASYIVIEEEDGLVVVDQHALHEKVLYERILAARQRGMLAQPLLVPEPVELDPEEWEEFVEGRDALAELGLVADEFGASTALVRTVPAGFEERAADRLLRDLLERVGLARRGASDRLPDLRERLLQTMACKLAVKAGDPLSPEAVADLVRARASAQHPEHCPHGRPAELRIGWDELARRFDRR